MYKVEFQIFFIYLFFFFFLSSEKITLLKTTYTLKGKKLLPRRDKYLLVEKTPLLKVDKLGSVVQSLA